MKRRMSTKTKKKIAKAMKGNKNAKGRKKRVVSKKVRNKIKMGEPIILRPIYDGYGIKRGSRRVKVSKKKMKKIKGLL